MADQRRIGGELHLDLLTIAEVYRVEPTWLAIVYDRGLLGGGVREGTVVYLPAARLDLVARVVHLHVVLGLGVDAIEVSLARLGG
jgi:hypothetical protein